MRSVVREVAGFSPYERRVLELLRNSKVRELEHYLADAYNDDLSQDKKARKLTKKRVGCCIHGPDDTDVRTSLVHCCGRSANWRSLALSFRRVGGHTDSQVAIVLCMAESIDITNALSAGVRSQCREAESVCLEGITYWTGF